MKKNSLLLIAILLLFNLSCSTIHKAKQSNKTTIDSTAALQQKKVEKKDSSTIAVKENVVKNTANNFTGSGINIDFYEDTAKPSAPLIIYQKGDSMIINTGNRKIKSLSKQSAISQKQDNYNSYKTIDSTHIIDSIAATLSQQNTVAKTINLQTKNKEVKPSFLAHIGIIAIILFVLILVALFAKYRFQIIVFIEKIIARFK